MATGQPAVKSNLIQDDYWDRLDRGCSRTTSQLQRSSQWQGVEMGMGETKRGNKDGEKKSIGLTDEENWLLTLLDYPA
jgi:hypothetical protein